MKWVRSGLSAVLKVQDPAMCRASPSVSIITGVSSIGVDIEVVQLQWKAAPASPRANVIQLVLSHLIAVTDHRLPLLLLQ